jgi:uncharacterized membrane protein YfcA
LSLDLWSLPFLAAKGLITLDTFRAILVALPLMILGIALGERHFLKTSPESFRRFAILLLAGLALLGLVRSGVR